MSQSISHLSPKPTIARPSRFKRWRWYLLATYLLLLLISYGVRTMNANNYTYQPAQGEQSIVVQAVEGNQLGSQEVRIAYQEYGNEPGEARPTIVLLHGSPGSYRVFANFAAELASTYRVIVPDLPGFGNSTRQIPDYSIRAHAHYVFQLLDQLDIQEAHVLGFSMGGGVAIDMADIAPERVSSITMLSAIGVQEMELLGDYYLNHTIHGIQLGFLWLLREGVPHGGLWDNTFFGVEYARNFYDSDQRPLRAILEQYEAPMLILQGQHDMNVPAEAGLEHARIVPQSELRLLDDDHFMIFTAPGMLAGVTADFLQRVEAGEAITRQNAKAERIAQAAKAFDYARYPQASGIALVTLLVLIALATFILEDPAAIGAGVMVAQGRLDFLSATVAVFFGIFIGDMLLYLAGRFFGRPALTSAPLKWMVKPEDVDRSSSWFSHRGAMVILASRPIPGLRLPTYFAAGVLRTNFWKFSLYFLIAAALWSPFLVGMAALLGAEVFKTILAKQGSLITLLGTAMIVWLALKPLFSLSTYRGRRLLVSSIKRKIRWEFWPMWAIYPPVVAYIAWLGIKYRSLTLFTLSNPAIEASGFVGESKASILGGFASPSDESMPPGSQKNEEDENEGGVAKWAFIKASLSHDARFKVSQAFMAQENLSYPIVLKGDMGQRGSDVSVVRSEDELKEYLVETHIDTIIQEHIPGKEFGIFYYRLPNEAKGHIFSITEKRMPTVVGDGKRTLEELILAHERAIYMAPFFLKKQCENLFDVLAPGETLQLVELGVHSRGSLFLDGSWIYTPELDEAIDRLSKKYEGFYFGRYDIRVPSYEQFKAGKGFKVIELNGVTSEATHMYDPKYGLFDAYKILFEQWGIAFEIGAQNRERYNLKPISLIGLLKLYFEYKKETKNQPE